MCNSLRVYIWIDGRSYESEALIVLQYQLQVALEDLFVLVLGKQQHVEAGVSSGQVGSIGVPLYQKFKGFQSVYWHSIGPCDEGQEVLLLFVV